ncbi:unnamed protein product [Brassicogethes aeneus]|uniref:THAP-type domain-containing protein n=1 Tax=Brassicogethes aeneus TaxID=1431903 RepID=A0A9P0AUN8_BRAAE|nr:unnamed protein product [Brassicogethes aeneus]
MVAIHCVVKSCVRSKESKHSFPNPSKNLDLLNKWVMLCANKRLRVMTPQKIYTNCRVCSKHFNPKDFSRNKRLGRKAYPTLLLPDDDVSDDDVSDDELKTNKNLKNPKTYSKATIGEIIGLTLLAEAN